MEPKVALITGGTSGIGWATVKALQKESIRTAFVGRDALKGIALQQELIDLGGEAYFVEADLADYSSHQRLVLQTIQRWGRLDYIVNSAATVCNKPISRLTHEDWDSLFTINLKATFFIIQAALPELSKSHGAVVNISSMNALQNGNNNLIYDSLKAALNHMTRGLAKDLLGNGIRFNALLPGGTDTPLLNRWFQQAAGEKEVDHLVSEMKHASSLALPEQIADAVVLLLSDRASWINGADIRLDGGYSL